MSKSHFYCTHADLYIVYIGAVPTDTDPKELGTIVVKIKRVAIVGKHSKNAPIVPRPPLGGQRSVGAEDPVGIGYVAYNASLLWLTLS